ncbi:UNVERIFIED_CONTAM: Retrovirus-related Pol polyprotein from type-2 retrotransposable element R2DM [Sesamum radiatum]|uniref:Retrovirus-related Pol polyprotein from type-2 retrotransposable element R2DM n=1 Tax=Sesamum radiatum TaxID=300843 RepID=A0AAW2IQQ4_SESRA
MDYTGPGDRIWLGWDGSELDVEILESRPQLIHCKVLQRRTHTRCLITVVYGSYDATERRELWDSIAQLSTLLDDLPWLLLGDFNVVFDNSEISGHGVFQEQPSIDFQQCLLVAGLSTLPMRGAPFSWYNRRDGQAGIWKRLDRILANDVWLERWPSQYYLCSTPRTSDHSPVILRAQDQRRNARVATKLKALKGVFRQIRREKGDLHNNVITAAEFLAAAQLLQQRFEEDSFVRRLEQFCRQVYAKAVALERASLKQRAKLVWLKEGDMCSQIFFRKISARRAISRIYQIHSTAGILLQDQDDILEEFSSYYQTLLGGVRRQSALNLDHLIPLVRHRLTETDAIKLEAVVTAAEVRLALFSIDDDKAPGPDGYSTCFFKKAWPVCGPEIIAAVQEFFSSGKLLKQFNATLLCLIPKVELPHGVADFRPITCCNVLYKTITKIMVERMTEVMCKLVSINQTAFVQGRSISENIMLAQDLFAGYHRKRFPPSCALKVDLKKAFDSIEWEFLEAALNVFNFPATFRGWIMECVSSATFSISLNGSTHGFFKGARGLRQGDPLSPYLFVIVMEMLNLIIKERILQSDQFCYHWRCKELELVMLSFADDLLLFSKADNNSIALFKDALSDFATASGLTANPSKSVIIFSKSASGMTQALRPVLNFQVGTLPVRDGHVTTSHLLHAFNSSRYAKVPWHIVCLPKDNGGQGIPNLWALNQALMSKHVWDIITGKESSIWVQWVQQYRLLNKSLWEAPASNSTWAWKKLLSICSKLGPMLQFHIATGEAFWLWRDPWHPLGKLGDRYPRAPMVTGLSHDAKLSAVILHGGWNWPSQTDTDVMAIMENLPHIVDGEDSVGWRTGHFSTSEAYRFFSPSPGKLSWCSLFLGPFKIPRNQFVLWLAILDKLSTGDKVWLNISPPFCCLCGSDELETRAHLFFDCAFSRRCLFLLRQRVKFLWPFAQHWSRGLEWGIARYRGRHFISAAYRATFASLFFGNGKFH